MLNRILNAKWKFFVALNLFIFIRENPHKISDIATISTAKHQHSGKSLKIGFKPLKELEKGTPHKDVASLFDATKNTLSTWKKKKKSKTRKM